MRYSYEFIIKCVQMYQERIYPDILKEISIGYVRNQIRNWVRMEEV